MLEGLQHRYVSMTPLRSGGMAHLFVAERINGGRVVVKQLNAQLAFEADARDLFMHEARIAMRLRHEHIVRVFDLFEVKAQLTLEMELVDGLDVRSMLTRTGLFELAHALYVTTRVLQALEYVHDLADEEGRPLGLIHRDVSIGNVLLARDGGVKLTDFGIARSTERIRQTVGVVRGTLAAISPEQATGAPMDRRADLFSVGALLYTLLAGRGPFEAASLAMTVDRLRSGQFAPIATDGPSAAVEGLNALLRRALAPDPGSRFADAPAMRSALETIEGQLEQRFDARAAGERVELALRRVAPASIDSQQPTAPDNSLPSTRADAPAGLGRQKTRAVAPPGPRSRSVQVAVVMVAAVAAVAAVAWALQPAPVALAPIADQLEMPDAAVAVLPPAPVEPASEPPPTPPADPRPSSPRPVAVGLLTIHATPWAEVMVDGKPLGDTPIRRLKLSSGSHRVKLSNAGLGLTRERKVDLAPGDDLLLLESFDGFRVTKQPAP